MAQKAIEMNQIKQVKQLKDDGCIPIKEIVRRLRISRKTVKKYLRKMQIFDAVNTAPGSVTKKEIVRIANTQKVITTTVYNSAGNEITVRKCSRPEEKLNMNAQCGLRSMATRHFNRR